MESFSVILLIKFNPDWDDDIFLKSVMSVLQELKKIIEEKQSKTFTSEIIRHFTNDWNFFILDFLIAQYKQYKDYYYFYANLWHLAERKQGMKAKCRIHQRHVVYSIIRSPTLTDEFIPVAILCRSVLIGT